MKKILSILVLVAISIFSLIQYSCKKEETDPEPKNNPSDTLIVKVESKKVFILNEGAWNKNNGSITMFERDSNRLNNYIFEAANPDYKSGDVIMDMGIVNDKVFIISNNTNVIKVANLNTFKQIEELSIIYPRYFITKDSITAYVSSGSKQGCVKLIDISTASVKPDSILVGNGPEHMAIVENELYVANSGGWSVDSTISVIDLTSKKVINTLKVGEAPYNIVVDANNDIWVLCIGNVGLDYNRGKSLLVKINHSTKAVEKTLVISETTNFMRANPLAISPDKTTIYYYGIKDIYAYSINSAELPSEPIINIESINGLSVDPENGDIYCFVGGYTSAGKMYIYNNTGVLKGNTQGYTVGIAPNGAVFSY
jgi:YVTN family beta-propeller protein